MSAVSASAAEDACIQPCSTCTARQISVCNALPHRELRRLADCLDVRDFAPGATLASEGEPADALFNITDGVVKLFKLLPDGRRQIVGFLFRGDFLGLSVGETYGFGAEAVTEVTACRFPRKAFRKLMHDSPELESELLSRASNELRAAHDQMLLLGRKTATERVASFLADLVARSERAGGEAGRTVVPMTRADMADYLGLTTETVSRAMTALKTDQIIRLLPRGEMQVLRPERLRALAGRIEA